MEVNLERVVRFYYVAEGLSFVKAAQRMNVDQTWLSRQIQQLETQLDCRLLERNTRHVSLTAEGNEFFEAARELADAARKVRAVAGSLGTPRRRELVLGISDTIFWAPEKQRLIEVAATRHPELSVNTVVRSGSQLWQKLRERDIDICIAGIAEDMENLDYVTIHRSRPSLLIPEEHALANVSEIHMSDLSGVEFAIPVIDNKIGFQQVYKPFLDAGALPHWVSEGPLAAMHYAATHRTCLVAWGFNIVTHGFALRPVKDCTALLQVVAARNQGDDREAVRKFWASPMLVAKQLDADFPDLRNQDWNASKSSVPS